MFINRNDTLVATDPSNGQLLLWLNGSSDIPKNISANSIYPHSIFVTDDDQIFLDNYCPNLRINRWSLRNQTLLSAISTSDICWGLFIDSFDDLYCSEDIFHRVVKYAWRNPSPQAEVVVGTKCAGSTSFMLSSPRGIFITETGDLYVADCGNQRIQMFRRGELNATTVAGNGASGLIYLSYPTDVIVDGGGYLFIVDSQNHRIVGSDASGFRCVAGCGGSSGSAANQLFSPQTLRFDSMGNLYVVDTHNFRIQKFDLLVGNHCSKLSKSSWRGTICLTHLRQTPERQIVESCD